MDHSFLVTSYEPDSYFERESRGVYNDAESIHHLTMTIADMDGVELTEIQRAHALSTLGE